MLLLSAPFDPAATAPPRGPRGALAVIAGLTGLLVAGGGGWALVGPGPAGAGRAVILGAVHAGLIAVGWVLTTGTAPGWHRPVFRLGLAMVLASLAAGLVPWGPLALALMPLVLLVEASGHPRLRALGLARSRIGYAALGLAAGAFLGAHLLVTASLTFGYHVGRVGAHPYASALAYDAGANVLSAEWLFRGAVFSALWRRGGFWPAALASTALALVRYLLDPALPHAPEARAGAVFYLGLVGLTACALRAWSGSLLPGYLAGLGFFGAYRLLTP
ncbi:MAG TPA: CPBP family glutamic-type intramembrane protease [Methylomirabilota bacterium]|nr:CPBP family glutamic-type intramembrane protease [Methylomirabilota bacterium]